MIASLGVGAGEPRESREAYRIPPGWGRRPRRYGPPKVYRARVLAAKLLAEPALLELSDAALVRDLCAVSPGLRRTVARRAVLFARGGGR